MLFADRFKSGSGNFKLKIEIRNPKSQKGAALIALLALMSIIALLLLAVAPNLMMEVQREKEIESIRRGEEIAEAIRIYAFYNNKLPSRIEDLLEGVQVPGRTKKRMVLRLSSAKDPLSSNGEWKLVQSGDKVLVDFQRKVLAFNNNVPLQNPEPKRVFDQYSITLLNTINTETSEETDPPGGEDDSDNVEGPFVGVVSRSQRKSIIAYYGIERHDWWIFTPLFRGASQQGGIEIPRGQRPFPTPSP